MAHIDITRYYDEIYSILNNFTLQTIPFNIQFVMLFNYAEDHVLFILEIVSLIEKFLNQQISFEVCFCFIHFILLVYKYLVYNFLPYFKTHTVW